MRDGVLRLKQGAWALLLVCGSGFAHAQDGLQFMEGAALTDCLLPAVAERGAPAYPRYAFAENRGAKVQARMVFKDPELAPDVQITSDSRDVEFEREVREYLGRYRMPCMKKGQAALTAKQEFTFRASDRQVAVSRDIASSFLSAHRECLSMVALRYPTELTRKRALGKDAPDQANIILDITFKQRDQAPQVRTVYGGADRMLEAAAIDAASEYRYHCEITDAQGLTARQQYRFLIEDGARARFQNTDAGGLLRMAEQASLPRVKFDTNTMGCPFDLRVTMYQPFDKNGVQELDGRNPDRQALVDLVRNMQFKIPKKLVPMLIGDSFFVQVPCLEIDLT